MRVAARLLSRAKRLIARDAVEGCPIPVRSAIHFPVTEVFFFINHAKACFSMCVLFAFRSSASSTPSSFTPSLRRRSASAGPVS